jgi:hypothetical protein
MENHKRRYGPASTATISDMQEIEQEQEMLRSEFEIMQKCDFTFIKKIGASSAEEYIVKITSLEFLQEEPCEKDE